MNPSLARAALVLALLASALTRAPQAIATVIRVPAQAPTIQQGIDAAATGDTVLVAAGNYIGPQNRDLDFHGKNLVVRSEAGYPFTIIDCQLLGRGFYLHTGESSTARIEGFTVRRGLALEPDYKGGGILCEGTSPTITDCRIQECEAFNGGGMRLSGPPIELRRCIVTNNRSDLSGGGISCERASLFECTISNNLSGYLSAGYGGGIDNSLGLVMTDCIVAGNTSQSYGDDGASFADGGGVYVGHAAAEAPVAESSPAVPRLSVAPNPIRDAGRVEWQTGTAPGRLLLYDPAGRMVIARELNPSPAGPTQMSWETLVGGRPLPSGIYYLRLDPMPRALPAVPVIVLR